MTPPDHLGDDGTPHAGDGVPAQNLTRLRGVLDGTYASKNGTVSGVTRDAAGRITRLVEDGTATTVTRGATGAVATVTTGSTTRTITRDGSGRIVSVA